MVPATISNSRGENLDFAFHPGCEIGSLVVLGHGVTGNKDRPLMLAMAEGLSNMGWPCLRLSFSGNGASEGCFEDSNIHKGISDLQSVFDVLPQGTRIAYCGHSMGGATGVLTATRDPRMNVLVTLAGMVHTRDFVRREFGDTTPGGGCMWEEPDCPLSQSFVDDLDGLDNILDAAAAVEIPWLLVHGTADDVVPPADSQDALRAAHGIPIQLLEIEGGGHSFDETSYVRVVTAIDGWLRAHL